MGTDGRRWEADILISKSSRGGLFLRTAHRSGDGNGRTTGLKKVVPNQPAMCSLLFPSLATSRRFRDDSYYSRIAILSVSRPFFNVSGAASPLRLGTNPRVPRARIPLNYNDWLGQALLLIGLCGWVGRAAGSWGRDVVEGEGDGGGRSSVNAADAVLVDCPPEILNDLSLDIIVRVEPPLSSSLQILLSRI